MNRQHLSCRCQGAALIGTLDDAPGTTGLLWVSGGSEVRSGAFAGQALLAADIAAAGYPVFRFDRRGVGDSEGADPGFARSGPDLEAAMAAFRQARPDLTRIVGFGNCDAATALILNNGAGCAGLVLSNPWTIAEDEQASALPPAAIRTRYLGKLKNPREWLRLARGQVALGKLATGLASAAKPAPAPSNLAEQVAGRLAGYKGPVRILLAERDRTAQVFLASWNPSDPRVCMCTGASHAFVEPAAREWLRAQLLAALADE